MVDARRNDTEILSRLRQALKGYQFDPDEPASLLELALHTGIAADRIKGMFAAGLADMAVVQQLCTYTALDLQTILSSPEVPQFVYTIYPYGGGNPIRLTVPHEHGEGSISGPLFFYAMPATEPQTTMIGTRVAGAPQVDKLYTIEDEESVDVWTCVANNADGIKFSNYLDPAVERTISPRRKLRLAHNDGQPSELPEPTVTGRILWQVFKV